MWMYKHSRATCISRVHSLIQASTKKCEHTHKWVLVHPLKQCGLAIYVVFAKVAGLNVNLSQLYFKIN